MKPPKAKRAASVPAMNASPPSDLNREDSYKHYPMTKITDTIYLGSDYDASNEVALRKEKITHCLSMVARKWKKKRVSGLFKYIGNKDIKRKCVPMSDTGCSNVVKLLEERAILSFMEESQKKNNKLLVHCQLGQNRSPTIVMAFLMKYHGLSFYRAWRKVKQKRVIVQPNKRYIEQLRNWDVYLNGKHSTPKEFLTLQVKGDEIKLQFESTNTILMEDVLKDTAKKIGKSKDSSLDHLSISDIDIDLDNYSPRPSGDNSSGNIFNDSILGVSSEEEVLILPNITIDKNHIPSDDSEVVLLSGKHITLV